MRRPSADACLAVLTPEDRATIARWEVILGLPFDAIPPLRQIVETLAILVHSADLDLPYGDAIRAASESLGLPDSDGASHPGNRFARTLLRWHSAAKNRQIDDARNVKLR